MAQRVTFGRKAAADTVFCSQHSFPIRRARPELHLRCFLDVHDYSPLYLQGIELFNQCEFFEAHEAWEELWQEDFGPSRKFFQGLIQASVALHHFCNGNIRGAKKVFYGSCGYLEPYRPVHMGLDLDAFLGQLKTCFVDVIAATDEFPQIDIVADTIPEIHLDPPPVVPEAE